MATSSTQLSTNYGNTLKQTAQDAGSALVGQKQSAEATQSKATKIKTAGVVIGGILSAAIGQPELIGLEAPEIAATGAGAAETAAEGEEAGETASKVAKVGEDAEEGGESEAKEPTQVPAGPIADAATEGATGSKADNLNVRAQAEARSANAAANLMKNHMSRLSKPEIGNTIAGAAKYSTNASTGM